MISPFPTCGRLDRRVRRCLLTDVIEYHERSGEQYEPASVVTDVMDAIGFVHTSFAIHKEVEAVV